MSDRKTQIHGIDIRERDIAVMRGLFESRLMTAAHIAILYFNGSGEAAKKRLGKLKTAGLIGERRQSVIEPAILFLTRKSFAVLREYGVLTEYPPLDAAGLDKRTRVSDLTLRHELEIMDVKAAFHSAVKKADNFKIAEFSTWPLLYQFNTFRPGYSSQEVVVKPDGFIRIHEQEKDASMSEHTFFLEVDRSSETLDTLVARAGCYLNYYSSGGFAVKNGAPRSAAADYPFRVLMVFKSAERRNNTAERLLQSNPPILTQAYLSTIEEVKANPFGAIWICPSHYRNVTKGSPFDPGNRIQTWNYRRQTEREFFVEKKIQKLSILAQ